MKTENIYHENATRVKLHIEHKHCCKPREQGEYCGGCDCCLLKQVEYIENNATEATYLRIPVSYMNDKTKEIIHAWLLHWSDNTFSDGGPRNA